MHLARLIIPALAALSASAANPRDLEPQVPRAEEIPIALLVDLGSGQVLHERNADRRFMPASITKVMTTFVAFELIDSGKLQRQQIFTPSLETFRAWKNKGSTMFLPHDARVSVDQLIHGVTTVSANDGSVVLAEGATGSVSRWAELMNAKARQIGMTNSNFSSPNGWMDGGKTFVTARDLTRLADAMITRHPELYRHFVGRPEYRYNNITQRNHDPLIGRVRGADGIKTGFTNEAGYGYLGSVERDGRRLALVVAGADRARQRNRAAQAYAEWGFSQFESKILFHSGEIIAEVEVQNGSVRNLPLMADAPLRISLPKNRVTDLEMRIEYEGPRPAPIAKGEDIATLVVSGEGVPEARIPLQAGEDVQVAGFLARIFNGIAGWLS